MKTNQILMDITSQGFTRNDRTTKEIAQYVRDIYKCSYYVANKVSNELSKYYF
jgi:hypothetical protein